MISSFHSRPVQGYGPNASKRLAILRLLFSLVLEQLA